MKKFIQRFSFGNDINIHIRRYWGRPWTAKPRLRQQIINFALLSLLITLCQILGAKIFSISAEISIYTFGFRIHKSRENQLCAKAQESRSDKESLAKDSMCCFRSSLLRVGISIRIYTLSILAAQALYSAVLQTGSKALLVKMLVGW